MKHLITGGSGFLGNLIARRLHESGEEVTILDIWEDPTRPSAIKFIHCDVLDAAGIEKAIEGIDVVHHNAALVPITKSGKRFWDVNVEGSKHVANAAVKAGVKQFVYMSSSAIFGSPKSCPIKPDTDPTPIESYGTAKWVGKQETRKICEKAGIQWIAIRPRTVIGEGRLGIFKILFDWIKDNRNIYILGNGHNKFQFIHAYDLMDAYMTILKSGLHGPYNVGTSRFGTLREMLENLIKEAGSKSKVIGLPVWPAMITLKILDILKLSPLGPYHYRTYHKNYYFDMDPVLKLGWNPKYSNDQMMKESYDWFNHHQKEIADEPGQSPHRKELKEGILKIIKKLS